MSSVSGQLEPNQTYSLMQPLTLSVGEDNTSIQPCKIDPVFLSDKHLEINTIENKVCYVVVELFRSLYCALCTQLQFKNIYTHIDYSLNFTNNTLDASGENVDLRVAVVIFVACFIFLNVYEFLLNTVRIYRSSLDLYFNNDGENFDNINLLHFSFVRSDIVLSDEEKAANLEDLLIWWKDKNPNATDDRPKVDLETLINNIKNRTPFIGTPPATEAGNLNKFYDGLENILKYVVFHISKASKEEQGRVADLFAEAGACCGTRYLSDALTEYNQISGNLDSSSLQNTTGYILSNFRQTIAESEIQKHLGLDVHGSNLYISSLGSRLGLPASQGVVEYLLQNFPEGITKESLIKSFSKEYKVKDIRDYIKNELSKNAEFRELFLDWVKDSCDEFENVNKWAANVLDARKRESKPQITERCTIDTKANLLNAYMKKKQNIEIPKDFVIESDMEAFYLDKEVEVKDLSPEDQKLIYYLWSKDGYEWPDKEKPILQAALKISSQDCTQVIYANLNYLKRRFILGVLDQLKQSKEAFVSITVHEGSDAQDKRALYLEGLKIYDDSSGRWSFSDNLIDWFLIEMRVFSPLIGKFIGYTTAYPAAY